jgi:hypothetical protein
MIDELYSSQVDLPRNFGFDILLFLVEMQSKSVAVEWERSLRRFEARLYDRWSEPLERLQSYMVLNLEVTAWFQSKYSIDSHTNRALGLVHARACDLAMQIYRLLKGGYPDGAIGRWRTLHEIAVTARLIAKFGDETAERYIDYHAVKNFYDAKKYQEHHTALGFEPLDENTLDDLEEQKCKLVKKHGEDLDDGGRGGGWMKHLPVGSSMFRREEEVGLEFLHPFYDLANSRIHAGSKGVLWRMGRRDFPDNEPFLFGASNYGLADPGQLTALSLSYVTSSMLSQNITPTEIIAIQLLNAYASEIATKFNSVQEEIRQDELAL